MANHGNADSTRFVERRSEKGNLHRVKARRTIAVMQTAPSVGAGNRQAHWRIAFAAEAVVNGIGEQFLDDQLHALLASIAYTRRLRLPAQVTEQFG